MLKIVKCADIALFAAWVVLGDYFIEILTKASLSEVALATCLTGVAAVCSLARKANRQPENFSRARAVVFCLVLSAYGLMLASLGDSLITSYGVVDRLIIGGFCFGAGYVASDALASLFKGSFK